MGRAAPPDGGIMVVSAAPSNTCRHSPETTEKASKHRLATLCYLIEISVRPRRKYKQCSFNFAYEGPKGRVRLGGPLESFR